MEGRIWEPFQIGEMELKNRIMMAPMVTQYASKKGYATKRIKNYYEARARGGSALVIVEGTYIHPRGQGLPNLLNISDDKFISGMSELVEVIHRHDTKAALQIYHCGRKTTSKLIGVQPVAPSSLASPGGEVPKELTIDEIAKIITDFAGAALRAKLAGFDGVEIHGAHGFLIDQFLSRSSNKRQDSYGGDLPNRTRFLIEIIRNVKEAVGKNYPVWCRINGKVYEEGGTNLEEAQEIARMTQGAGANAIHVSAFGSGNPIYLTSPTFVPAVIANLAEGIKKVVNIPVIAVGKITLEAGERILKEGRADFISIGRALLADPEYINKIASGKQEDITPCIECGECSDSMMLQAPTGIRCRVNDDLGKEEEDKIIPK